MEQELELFRQRMEEMREQERRELREEIQRMREGHAEEVARINRAFQIELERLRMAAQVQPEPLAQAPALEVEVAPNLAQAQDEELAAEGEQMPASFLGVEGLENPAVVPVVAVQPALDEVAEGEVESGEETDPCDSDGGAPGDMGGGEDTYDEDLTPAPPRPPAVKVRAVANARKSLRLRGKNSKPSRTSLKVAATRNRKHLIKSLMPSRRNKSGSGLRRSTRSRRATFKLTTASKQAPEPEVPRTEEPQPARRLSCDTCGVSLSSEKSLNRHMKDIHQEPVTGRFPCDVCGKRFSYKSYFHAHLKTHTQDQNYKCDECGKILQNRHGLERHRQTHNPERSRDFLCTACDKACFTQGDLDKHLVTHQRMKLYRCPHCPMRFKMSNNLGKHLETHSNRKPFSCEQCEASYKRAYDLKVHLRKHTGVRPYPCQSCQMSFRRSAHLKAHVLQIHREGRVEEEKAYSCPVCGAGFTRKTNCKKHQRKRHPIQLASAPAEDRTGEAKATRRSRRLTMKKK